MFRDIVVAGRTIIPFLGIVSVLAFDLPASAMAYAVLPRYLGGEIGTAPARIGQVRGGMGRTSSHVQSSSSS